MKAVSFFIFARYYTCLAVRQPPANGIWLTHSESDSDKVGALCQINKAMKGNLGLIIIQQFYPQALEVAISFHEHILSVTNPEVRPHSDFCRFLPPHPHAPARSGQWC